MHIIASKIARILCFYVAYVTMNILVAYTHRNGYFMVWATVSALCALFVLFRALLCYNCVFNVMSDK